MKSANSVVNIDTAKSLQKKLKAIPEMKRMKTLRPGSCLDYTSIIIQLLLSLTANKSHSSNITLMIIYYFSKTFQYPKILIYGLSYLVHYL